MRCPALLAALATFLLLLALRNSTTAAPISSPKIGLDQNPVQVLADTMSYNQETGVYVAYGNAEIHQAEKTLTADMIEYYQQTQTARARGNVVLSEGNDVLACDYLEVNLETKEGLVSGGKLFYQKENFHLEGSYLEKLGEDRYRIENGSFTTCDGKRPAWKFTCKEADITLEGSAKVKGATFRIKDYPVFYFPYLIYPTKTKRQSGFLMPSAGSSSSEGINFDNAYYWAISPNTDATAYLDFASKKGTGLGGEYRYIANEANRGRLYGYFISERSNYRREEYDNPLDREKERWNIFYEGKNDFTQDLFARCKVDLVSDRQFYKDYGSQTELRTAERTETTAFLTKHWERISLVGDVEYNRDLLKSNDPTVQRYPQIFLTGLPQQIFQTPLFFNFDSSYDNFSRNEGEEGNRLDCNPRIMLPLRLHRNVLLQSEAGYRQTLYFDTSDDEDLDDDRGLFNFYSELSTKFMRVYRREGDQRRRLRHTVEPQITWTYVPDKGQEDLPLYDEVDRIDEQNRIAFAVANRLVGKYYRLDNTNWERELLFLRIGQFYDATTSHDPFSDFFLELRSRPSRFCYIKSNLEFDCYDQEFDTFNTLVRFQDRRGDFLRVEYRFSKDQIEEIDTHAGLELTREVGVFFLNRHAQQASRSLETIFGLDYHPQCWGTILSYRRRPGTEGRDREQKFLVEFYLKGIGKVGGFHQGLN